MCSERLGWICSDLSDCYACIDIIIKTFLSSFSHLLSSLINKVYILIFSCVQNPLQTSPDSDSRKSTYWILRIRILEILSCVPTWSLCQCWVGWGRRGGWGSCWRRTGSGSWRRRRKAGGRTLLRGWVQCRWNPAPGPTTTSRIPVHNIWQVPVKTLLGKASKNARGL